VEDSDEQVSVPIIDISWIPMKWWPLITSQEERLPHPQQIHRTYFEICVFSHLLLEVQSGDMYVDGSNEYSDYYSELISWEEYHATVEDYAQEVDLPVNPSEFVAQLKQWLGTRATQTDQSFPNNSKLSFDKDRFVVHRYRRNNPADLAQLEALLKERVRDWPVIVSVMSGEPAKWHCFAKADAAIAASGTILLELAMARVPCISIYKTDFMIRMMMDKINIWSAALPNIIIGYPAISEYLDGMVRGGALAKRAARIAIPSLERQAMIEAFDEVHEKMQVPEKPSLTAAQIVLSYVKEKGA